MPLNKLLFPFERSSIPPDAVGQGLVPHAWARVLTFVLTPVVMGILWPYYAWLAVPMGFALTRLAVLDLTAYLLPHLYTYPLLAGGLTQAWMLGEGFSTTLIVGGVLAIRWLFLRYQHNAGLGGGDFMLLAAMLAWMPSVLVMMGLAVGCLLWFPVTLFMPKQPVPLGVPMIIAWLVVSMAVLLPFAP